MCRRRRGCRTSRATIAECDRRPPLSVTIAPSNGNRILKASDVAPSRGRHPGRSGRTRPGRHGGAVPWYMPGLAASPRSKCLRARARSSQRGSDREPHCGHEPQRAREAGRKGRVGAEGASQYRRSVLRAVGGPVLGTGCQLVRRWAARGGEKRPHLVQACIDEMLGLDDSPLGGEPPASRQRGPPHEARGPDVAVRFPVRLEGGM